MSDESEIAITIIPDDQANVDTATSVEVQKGETTKVDVKDPALQELMSQYKELEQKSAEAERRAKDAETRRLEAEREASKHREDAETSRKREKSSQLDTVTTAISASEQDVESAKAAMRAAKSTGDIDAEVEASDRLARARATLQRLDEARQDIEARIKAPPQRQAASNDPVETFVQNRTPETAAWIRSHPEYVRSEKGLKKLTAADAVAQAEDLVPDTPEYFARVEEYLGISKAAAEAVARKEAPTEAAQVKAPKLREAPPVAPGSSVSSSNGGASGGSAVTLTKREADAAVDGTHVWQYDDPKGKFKKGQAIGVQEFARRKLSMMKAGYYDRSYENQ